MMAPSSIAFEVVWLVEASRQEVELWCFLLFYLFCLECFFKWDAVAQVFKNGIIKRVKDFWMLEFWGWVAGSELFKT